MQLDDENRVNPDDRNWKADLFPKSETRICADCGQEYIGYSHRLRCFVCATEPPPNPSRAAYRPYR